MIAPLAVLLLLAQAPPTVPAPNARAGDGDGPIFASSRLLASGLNYYFSPDDYPAMAIRMEAEGTTGFRVAIGPNGRVSECTVTRSAGNAPLDAATCRILRARLRYAPVGAPRGARAATSDEGWVRWRLPPDRPPPPAVETSHL
jgi:periplasmic protein TonB